MPVLYYLHSVNKQHILEGGSETYAQEKKVKEYLEELKTLQIKKLSPSEEEEKKAEESEEEEEKYSDDEQPKK